MDDGQVRTNPVEPHARFEFAPPRRFLLPAILLLLAEEPRHGYSVMKEFRELGFGPADRPSVYRALAQLEADGLVTSWADTPRVGRARHVYELTAAGEHALRMWMGVIKDDRDALDCVLRRYQATGSADAVMGAVERGWASLPGSEWSPVSSAATPGTHRGRFSLVAGGGTSPEGHDDTTVERDAEPISYGVDPERSVVLIEVRSSAGPISFGAIGVTGSIEAVVRDRAVAAEPPPRGRLEVPVQGLRSGNKLYDAEILRRIDARKFPIAALDLHDTVPTGVAGRYRLAGELTFHGVTRTIEGSVVATITSRHLVVEGEEVFDIRDFDVASPTVLMLRIFPDVRVRIHVEANAAGSEP